MGWGFDIGGSKNKSKTKTSNNVTVDPWSKDLFEGTAGKIDSLLSSPAQAYTGQLTAGPNALQTQAGEAAKGLLDYKPQHVSAQSFADADMSKYLNPETDNVINAALGDIEQFRQRQKVGDAQSATAAGAWGGSRHGVAESLTNENALHQAANTASSLRSQAYDNAANRFNQDRSAQLQADQFNANLGLAGAQMGLQGAGLLGQMGSQIYSQDQAGRDRQYAEFMRLYNDPFQRAGLFGSVLGAIPIGWDSQGTNKTTATNINASGGFKQ